MPGVTRSWLATYYPVTNAAGERIGVGAIVSDITERKRAEEEAEAARSRVELLAEAGELLASAVSYQEAVARIPAIVVPRIGDACSVFVAEDDGATLVRVGSAHANPELAAVLATLPARYEVASDSRLPIVQAFLSREPELIPVVEPNFASVAARDEDERVLLETLATRSAMVLPLVAGDRCFGVLSLSSLQPDRHGEEDFDLAKELARRLAVALDRARLYKETLESYALLEGLLASAPVGIGFWDPELRFVRVNEALAEINGIPPEEHIGRTLAEVLPELAPQLEPIYRRVLETGVPLIHEETTAETPTRPGGLRHWLTSYYPVVAEGGEPLGMAAVILEITEQKRAEEALHRSEERFRSLVTASTNIVWTTDASGAMVDESRSWEAFTGQQPDEYTAPGWGWLDAIHPEDRQHAATRWRSAIEAAEPVETSYRLRRGDGEYRRMAVSAIPILGPDGALREWVGTSTDVEEEQRSRTAVEQARERLSFLAEASRQLAASLDYERTLETVTNLPVGRIADWASVMLFESGGAVRRVAHAHVEPEGDELLDQLWWSYPLQLDDENPAGPPLRSGETVFLPEIEESSLAAFARDEEHLRLLRELGYASSIAVPFVVGGDAVGALTLVRSKQSAPYTQDDVELAEELARRAAIALDNARLFREAEDRARAAQALEFVGDGVFLVDREGLIRIWNPAAATITGLHPDAVLGRSAIEAIPGLGRVRRRASRSPTRWAARAPGPRPCRSRSAGRELWVSISGVGFGEGTVFAFRDVTGERGVEKMKSDFVSTVSHELRTPLAAIYGAAVTLRRPDMPIEGVQRDELLGVISSEAERLARIVNDILWTSRIESGGLQVTIERCDPVELATDIVQAQRLHLPPRRLARARERRTGSPSSPPTRTRSGRCSRTSSTTRSSTRRTAAMSRCGWSAATSALRFLVADEGLGIPPAEHERIFEKFYRLDPEPDPGRRRHRPRPLHLPRARPPDERPHLGREP